MIDYTLDEHNLHIKDSYKVRRWKMRRELEWVRDNDQTATEVFNRSIFSLKMEWVSHNALYFLGYQRERTKDADLDNPCDHPEWMYKLAGIGVTVLEIGLVAAAILGILILVF